MGGAKRKVLVFGNPMVERDSLPLRLLGKLRKKFPELEFEEFDPSENLENEGRELNIIDAVEGIKKVTLITDIDRIKTSKIYSMHDFDLGYGLKLLKKLDYLDSVKIFGVPMKISEKKALEQLSTLISSNLSRANPK
jgi:Ni,Fe-hydrogenase maturation factor